MKLLFNFLTPPYLNKYFASILTMEEKKTSVFGSDVPYGRSQNCIA